MGKTTLTIKKLKEIGIPSRALYFQILQKEGSRVYEITFMYRGRKYRTTLNDYYLQGYKDDDTLECIEVE